MNIADEIGLPALYEQLAEECSELAQASLKMARLMRGDNPTPKTADECTRALQEEIADVQLVMLMLPENDLRTIMSMMEAKRSRWEQRIREAKE